MFGIAVVVVCVLLTVLNLILTLGVLRRLREHAERLNELAEADTGQWRDPIIGLGSRPGPFSAVDVDGGGIGDAGLGVDTLVAFFSPDCGICAEWLPRFVAAATALGDRRRALAVVVAPSATDPAAAVQVAALRGAATVVVENDKGPLAEAFRVAGFPAMVRLDEHGTVLANRLVDVAGVPAVA
ncbi:hypothetical protein GCM10009558_051050 [Virgisporangium aurantiacum]